MDALEIVLLAELLLLYAFIFPKKKTCAVPRNYDVFLSGLETTTGFIDFLYNSLRAAGFRVFRDDNTLPVGEEINPERLRAIRTCRFIIPIISQQYVQSEQCLRELTELMECRRKHGKSVFPVFYGVDVFDIGRQRGNFAQALFEHERQCSPEEVLEWRKALNSVARIKGWISQTIAHVGEAELVEMVLERVSCELKTMWIDRLCMFIRSVCLHFSEKTRRDSKCQVFLAFFGLDTQNGLAAYLHTSLVAVGIRVFNYDDPSLIGKDVAHVIHNAIDHCKIFIPIVSENCNSSRWCLDDLAQMMECKRTKGQKTLPIFYKVKPSQVQDMSHRFRNDMLQHTDLEGESTYERWERALKEVGSFRGWESEKIANGHEEVLVKQVVQEVSRLLKNPQTHEPPMSIC